MCVSFDPYYHIQSTRRLFRSNKEVDDATAIEACDEALRLFTQHLNNVNISTGNLKNGNTYILIINIRLHGTIS